MNHLHFPVAVASLLTLIGCATSSVPNLEKNPIYQESSIHFDASLPEMKQVVREMAATLRCRTLAETDAYYKGQLPVGEVIEVFLKPNQTGQTFVWIKSRITYVGGAWQHNRREEVIQELKRAFLLANRKKSALPSSALP